MQRAPPLGLGYRAGGWQLRANSPAIEHRCPTEKMTAEVSDDGRAGGAERAEQAVKAALFPPIFDTNSIAGIQIPGLRASETIETVFPSISDYAFLSDCENSCLVAPSGSVEWLCLPKPHDPSVFGSILDRGAGSFRLSPAENAVPAHRQYLPGTSVLATTWQTRSGWIVIHDFLAVGPWSRSEERSDHFRRTPGDYDARHALVRIVTCLHGTVDVAMNCEVAFDYGRRDARWSYSGPSYSSAATLNSGFNSLSLHGDMRLGIEGRSVRARHRLVEGESKFVVLSWTDDPLPANVKEAETYLKETSRFWRNWIDGGRFPDHPWREYLQRSVLTLKGLTYAPTGALLAAATTSLPEHLGGTRNWDYRFTWVRDSAFTLRALHSLGFDTEADDFLAFLSEVLEPSSEPNSTPSERPDLQVLYPVDGAACQPEVELNHLTGYAASRPVRVGNGAFDQVQFDIFGAIVDCVFEHTRSRDALSERTWRVVVQAVEMALKSWRGPDRGIWEMRGEPKHYTFSKVMCWVAADRGARLAQLRGDLSLASSWRLAADEIHLDVLENGVNKDGVFTQSYGSNELDASLLMLPMVGFLPLDDERIRATVFAIIENLSDGAFVYRYATNDTDDGLDGELEHSFTVCSFWLVSALALIGELGLAKSHCERLIGAASSLGLYAEELDPSTSRHFGNFPQALTHLALINAVLRVVSVEERLGETSAGLAGARSWWNAAGRDDRSNVIKFSDVQSPIPD